MTAALSTVAVTGAAGFVGRALLPDLVAAGHRVLAVDRNPEPSGLEGVTWIQADLTDPRRYSEAMTGVDVVLHLAAVTGKASPAAYRASNLEATRDLLGAAEAAGVRRFVFMSSIAVRFASRQHYHYAESKIAAEEVVQRSTLHTTVLRPTMVFGPGSPVRQGLEKFARLPLSPVFGTGRVRIQPVARGDVVRLLSLLVEDAPPDGTVLELGGAETWTMDELLGALRAPPDEVPGRGLHIPLPPLRLALGLVEPVLRPLLPFTAGQLATFANDSLAAPHPWLEERLPARMDAFDTDPDHRAEGRSGLEGEGGGTVEGDSEPPDEGVLRTEFRRLARHLIGTPGTTYQADKYVAFHRHDPLGPINRFDRVLRRVAGWGRPGLVLADAYTGTLFRNSAVRCKLVLALSILEASPPTFAELDHPGPGRPWVWATMSVRVGVAAVALVVASLVLAPFHLVLGRGAGEEAR